MGVLLRAVLNRLPGAYFGPGGIEAGRADAHQAFGAVVHVFHQVARVTGLMADPGEVRRLAHPAVNLPESHGPV